MAEEADLEVYRCRVLFVNFVKQQQLHKNRNMLNNTVFKQTFSFVQIDNCTVPLQIGLHKGPTSELLYMPIGYVAQHRDTTTGELPT